MEKLLLCLQLFGNKIVSDNMIQEARELFCAEMAMARLGNGHFADLMTEDTPLAWDYDPMSYKDSNY